MLSINGIYFSQVLHMLKSLLMCGHPTVFQYTATCIDQLCRLCQTFATLTSQVTSDPSCTHYHSRLKGSDKDSESRDVGLLMNLLEELQLSTRQYDTAQLCAKHWTRNKRRKVNFFFYMSYNNIVLYHRCSKMLCGPFLYVG